MPILLLILVTFAACAQSTKIDQAKILYENRKYEESKRILLAVDEEQKEYAAAQFYLGRIAFDEDNLDDAADYFEEAVDANDKVAEYYNWLGNTYGKIASDANPIKQGMLAPKMKSAWERATELDPKNIEARKSLIQYYTQAPGFMGGSYSKAYEVAQGWKRIVDGNGFTRERVEHKTI